MPIYMCTPGSAGGGQGLTYSTTEQNTGMKWIDGKDIYFITVEKESTSNTTTIYLTTIVDNVSTVVNVETAGVIPDEEQTITWGSANNNTRATFSIVRTRNGSIMVATEFRIADGCYIGQKFYHTIWYTKKT